MMILEAVDVSYRYEETTVFEQVTFQLAKGESVAIIGPNGAGKSTFLRLLAGVLRPAAGEVRLFGTPIETFRDWQKVGYVPQNPYRQQKSFPITVREVVEMGCLAGQRWWRRLSATDHRQVNEALELVGMAEYAGRRLGNLSGGQQQRVFVARALAGKPELMLLDEPATGIDLGAKQELYALLARLNREQGISLVMVSHDVELAAATTTRMLCLDRGGLCFVGSTEEALAHSLQHRLYHKLRRNE